ncbi:amidohydrolase [Salinisphaera sp. PC39]|uniref:amidohydrolase family protein n=1 Tax=Salinisphaera sp. PC39 TaxID=1304156 RepID=UPI00333FC161
MHRPNHRPDAHRPARRRTWSRGALLLLSLGLSSAGCAGPADDDWDVTDTGQPYDEIGFTVDEGTWMSLAVSPDGETIAFDLLGDIYRIPAEGGEATLVHGGPAMQRAPRFSPDGSRLLYISDASGSDNLWTSDPDGGDARRITHETVDRLTGPAWGPEGDYVAAARFKSSFPELRASQIRLFDLAGGDGRVLVTTPDNGRDVQEANFSADGRHLYYTEKVTDPGIFVDANHINHVIMRRDLETGETEKVVGGFGGATTPQISPDGKHLAFVRRVKDKTVLFVHDTVTGKQRPVYAELDRDVQADFVPHGHYYPAYDWFPDNRHIAIWGKGELFRVDSQTGKAEKIPFEADTQHRYTEPPRFSQELAPERVDVRAVRQPAVAPDGGEFTFHALGHLWRQSLPRGEPERLTDADAFEFEPAYDPSGRRIAYVEWDDLRGGALKILSLEDGAGRTVVTSPGVIREPAFSADGERLTYRIEDGNKIMGGYQARGGIYWIDIDGGEPRRVAESGERPRFSPDGQRVLFASRAGSGGIYSSSVPTTVIESVNLDGHDRRKHAAGPDVSELHLSPGMRWLVFKQHQQYYATPYRETGRPLVVGKHRDELPVTRLTRYSGYGLTWSGDGTAYWTVGPRLYRADMDKRLAAGEPGEGAYAEIDLSVPGDAPEGTVAFVGGRIITMEGDRIIRNGTVIVRGKRIRAVGPADEVEVPEGAEVVDISGKTVMPGLVDMHGHIDCCYPDELMPEKHPGRYAALAFGVTTNYDPYSSELSNYAAEEMTRAGILVGPRFIGSGKVVYGHKAKTDFTYDPIRDYTDARRIMRRKKLLGGTIVKSYKQPMRSQRQQLLKAGRELGVMVDAEGGNHFYDNITQILDGHPILEHNLPVANYYEDLVKLMAHGDTANTPTLIVVFGEIMGENYMYQTTRAWDDPKVRTFVQSTNSHYSPLGAPGSAPPHVRGMTTLHAAEELYDIGFRSVARSVRELDEAGVRINAGSHGQIAGLSMHWEMWLLAEGGMDNLRVLRTGTINGAASLGLDEQIGSIAPGKLADLIVLDDNPLEDIRHTNSVRYTMINGRLYDAYSMDEIGHYDRPREPFYWELPDYNGIDWNEAWAGQ